MLIFNLMLKEPIQPHQIQCDILPRRDVVGPARSLFLTGDQMFLVLGKQEYK